MVKHASVSRDIACTPAQWLQFSTSADLCKHYHETVRGDVNIDPGEWGDNKPHEHDLASPFINVEDYRSRVLTFDAVGVPFPDALARIVGTSTIGMTEYQSIVFFGDEESRQREFIIESWFAPNVMSNYFNTVVRFVLENVGESPEEPITRVTANVYVRFDMMIFGSLFENIIAGLATTSATQHLAYGAQHSVEFAPVLRSYRDAFEAENDAGKAFGAVVAEDDVSGAKSSRRGEEGRRSRSRGPAGEVSQQSAKGKGPATTPTGSSPVHRPPPTAAAMGYRGSSPSAASRPVYVERDSTPPESRRLYLDPTPDKFDGSSDSNSSRQSNRFRASGTPKRSGPKYAARTRTRPGTVGEPGIAGESDSASFAADGLRGMQLAASEVEGNVARLNAAVRAATTRTAALKNTLSTLVLYYREPGWVDTVKIVVADLLSAFIDVGAIEYVGYLAAFSAAFFVLKLFRLQRRGGSS